LVRVRRATPNDDVEWIELLKKVQVYSDSWEAAYLKKPSFSSALDWVLENEQSIIGICAGHTIYSDSGTLYSVEVLAIDPAHRQKGYGATLIARVSEQCPPNSPLVFWTKCPLASAWYEKLGFLKIEEATLMTVCQGSTEEWRLTNKKQNGLGLKAYSISCPWTSIRSREASQAGKCFSNKPST
jgi:N-acetylglutamate synthase-like GNAT family acetyltransferase